MDNKINHLEMIHGVINRMASNSFMLKGLAVTLVTGIFALSEKDADKLYFLVAAIPIVAFWCLDAYYLLQERLYRSLYEKVRCTNEKDIDFSLKATTAEFGNDKNNFCKCLFSKTIMLFYCPLVAVCAAIIALKSLLL